jgi:hypothetical protein
MITANDYDDKVDTDTWTKVASGYVGDVIYWEAGFKALGEVQSILSRLEEVGEENVEWNILIGEHSYFASIEDSDFPPLYDVSDFETCFDDFLAVQTEPTADVTTGQSCNWLDLYVANDEKEQVIQKFIDFLTHLKSLNPLRHAGIV